MKSLILIGIVLILQHENIFRRLSKMQNNEINHPKPVIYTFITPGSSNLNSKLEMWTNSWNQAGWKTVILTINDAINHPDFEKTDAMANYYHYLAMSMLEDGGWFSETHVLPLFFKKVEENGFKLPNSGRFTVHNIKTPDLISANKEEWNRITSALLDSDHANHAVFLVKLKKEDPSSFDTKNDVMGINMLHYSGEVDFCGTKNQKQAISFSDEYVKQSGVMDRDDQSVAQQLMMTWKKTCHGSRPIMHTFFETAYGHSKVFNELDAWKKAWHDAGWEPVVLTLNDAKRHHLYEKFYSAFEQAEFALGQYDRMCFYRWLAMAVSGGGWMSDYDTLPLEPQPFVDAFTLPNNGNFTGFSNHVPCLLSGSEQEWNRMSMHMFNSYIHHTADFWSDMCALLEISQKPHGFIGANEVVDGDSIYEDEIKEAGKVLNPFSIKNKCQLILGKRAVHFSHKACAQAGYCHKNRAASASKWIVEWKNQCTA